MLQVMQLVVEFEEQERQHVAVTQDIKAKRKKLIFIISDSSNPNKNFLIQKYKRLL